MRLLAILVLALAVATSAHAQSDTTPTTPPAPDAGGAPAGPLEITIDTHTTPGSGYFVLAGETARNPIIRAAPGQEVRVTLRATDEGVHNFCVVGGGCSGFVTTAGEVATFTFKAPESGTLEYYCQPHRGAGMKGSVSVGAAGQPAPGAGDGGEISGETIDLGQYDPACAGRVAPAIVTTGIVGSPTLEDYIQACKPATDVQVDTSHPADTVIPISWLLIALGIGGIVWVHKYYKP